MDPKKHNLDGNEKRSITIIYTHDNVPSLARLIERSGQVGRQPSLPLVHPCIINFPTRKKKTRKGNAALITLLCLPMPEKNEMRNKQNNRTIFTDAFARLLLFHVLFVADECDDE